MNNNNEKSKVEHVGDTGEGKVKVFLLGSNLIAVAHASYLRILGNKNRLNETLIVVAKLFGIGLHQTQIKEIKSSGRRAR